MLPNALKGSKASDIGKKLVICITDLVNNFIIIHNVGNVVSDSDEKIKHGQNRKKNSKY